MEGISTKPDRPELFLDHHSVAFLSVKERSVIDPYIRELEEDEYFVRVMANIKCLATIQQRFNMQKFPGISDWMADIMDPVYERFHDRLLRTSLRKKIEKLRDTGDLSKIAGIMDNKKTISQDMNSFRQAMREYHELRQEGGQIEKKLAVSDGFSKTIGHEVAAVFSAIISAIMIAGLIFFYFISGSLF